MYRTALVWQPGRQGVASVTDLQNVAGCQDRDIMVRRCQEVSVQRRGPAPVCPFNGVLVPNFRCMSWLRVIAPCGLPRVLKPRMSVS